MTIRKLFTLILVTLLLILFFRSDVWAKIWLKTGNFFNTVYEESDVLNGLDNEMGIISDSDKEAARINLEDLKNGTKRKGAIPAIKNPKFVETDKSTYTDDEMIIGVYYNNEAKAYPYKILYHHEIVNDEIGGEPIAVTYCPLCETNTVFFRTIGAEETTFGVTGKLYQSCLVMYDNNTNTYWSQPWGLGIVGQNVNYSLERLPATRTTLGDWKILHPDTKVLSKKTGFIRNYKDNPYEDYQQNNEIIFSARNQDLLLAQPKELISYIWNFDNKTPFNEFSGNSAYLTHRFVKENGKIDMIFEGELISAIWDQNLNTVKFLGHAGIEVPASTAYAFVYPAFFESKE